MGALEFNPNNHFRFFDNPSGTVQDGHDGLLAGDDSGEPKETVPNEKPNVTASSRAFAANRFAADPAANHHRFKAGKLALDKKSFAEVITRGPNGTLVLRDDPGNYYCEHLFFSTQKMADQSASVLRDARGDKLVGFMHVPEDSPSNGYAGTKEYLGAGVAGYFDEAAGQVAKDEPIKLMVTGFSPWDNAETLPAKKNPSGDFIKKRKNIDGMMKEAFGADLLTPKGKRLENRPGKGEDLYRYSVRDRNGDTRTVLIRTDYLSVDDSAIDPNDSGSVARAMEDFQPHGVISMGLAQGVRGRYGIEQRADDTDLDGTNWMRDRGRRMTERLHNRSLYNSVRKRYPKR